MSYEYKTQSDLPELSPRENAVALAHRQARQARDRRHSPSNNSPSNNSHQQPHHQHNNNNNNNNQPVLSRHSSLDQYERLKTLGKGSFGRVDKVRDRSNGEVFALKTIRYQGGDQEERKTAFEEARLLKNLMHPSIVRFHEAFETSHREKMCIVMELCHGTLVQAQEHAIAQQSHFTERRILSWLFQVVLALEYLHGKKLLHRDIKPANIFLSSHGHAVKLGDFGLVRVLDQTFDMAKTRCGTPLYNCSPEICESRPYNSATDIWGLGVVMYELLQLRLPFTGKDKNNDRKPVHVVQLLRSVVNDEPDPLPTRYSSALRKLIITHFLNKDHTRRPTGTDILKIRFIQSHMTLFLQKPHPSVPQELLNEINDSLKRWANRGEGGSGGGGGGSGLSDGGVSNGRGEREHSQPPRDRGRVQDYQHHRDQHQDSNDQYRRRKSRSPARKPVSNSPNWKPTSASNVPSESPNFIPTGLMDVANADGQEEPGFDTLRQLSEEFEDAMRR